MRSFQNPPVPGKSWEEFGSSATCDGYWNGRGYTTTFVYDRLNRQQATIDAAGGRTTISYNAGDQVIANINARNYANTYTYDTLGRQVTQTDPLNHVTSTIYDSAGHVWQSIDALGITTSFAYDSLDRQITMQSPSGGVTSTAYDTGDRVTATIDPLGHALTSVYDHLNRVTQSIDALNGTTTFGYDAASNRTYLIDPVGNRTTFVYDELNRVTTETDPLNKSATFAYNAIGLMTSTTDRLGRRRDFTFDNDNRKLTEKWYTTTAVLDQIQTWTYDANGNALTAQDPHGNYTFTYDTVDRTSTVQEPFGQALTFTYDAAGNRTVVQDSQNGVTTSTYDAANRLTVREFGGSGQTKLKWENTYTNRDQISVATRYRWTGSAWSSIGTSEYTYDDAMRVTNIKHKDGSATIQANFTYTYDAGDRVTSAIDNGTTTSYSYDNTNQLTAAGAAAYSYDANGNRNMTGYTTGTGNRTTNDGSWTYTYDDAGNEIKKSKGASAETWNYAYDNRNQLISAEKHATDGGTLQAKMLNKYDAMGNRIERDEDADGNGTYETVQRFAYDGWKTYQSASGGKSAFIGQENFDVWTDLNGSNSLTTRRLFGDDFDQIAVRVDSGGTAAWSYQDRLGSVRNLVDATGTLQETLTYDGFGNILTDSNPTFGDRYKYSAREWDSLTKLQGNRARWYDPSTGKWTTLDPIGFGAHDANLYRYTRNFVIMSLDPSGYQVPEKYILDYEQNKYVNGKPINVPKNSVYSGAGGAFFWPILWKVSPAPGNKDKLKDGSIIQKIKITYYVKTTNGQVFQNHIQPEAGDNILPSLVDKKGQNVWVHYAERWNAYSTGKVTEQAYISRATFPVIYQLFATAGLPDGIDANDVFAFPGFPNSQGWFSIEGQATYYADGFASNTRTLFRKSTEDCGVPSGAVLLPCDPLSPPTYHKGGGTTVDKKTGETAAEQELDKFLSERGKAGKSNTVKRRAVRFWNSSIPFGFTIVQSNR